MALDPHILQHVLELRASAVGYAAGRALAEAVAPRIVLEMPGQGFDVWAFAQAGRCSARPREGLHAQLGSKWTRRGTLEDYMGSAWLSVEWEGKHLETVTLVWDRNHSREVTTWVLAEETSVAQSFATAVADFCESPPESVLVFSNGCWSRSKAAYRSMAQARREDLVLPAGFFERILADTRHFLSSRAMYEEYGLAYKRGLLFAGSPGNGKTACLRVLLRETGLPTLLVRSFNSRYGEVEQNVQSVFEKATRLAPCALVLEDLDVLVRGQALSALLNEMDGLGADTGIPTLATTNHPDQLDRALSDRPSRFDRVYRFDLPGVAERNHYLTHWNQRFAPELRVEDAVMAGLAERTEGFSFASLQELVVSAMVQWVADPGKQRMADLLGAQRDALVSQKLGATTASVQRHEEA